ncbi:MAG: ArnT family glycosyltransferase [Opitutales bacterium]
MRLALVLAAVFSVRVLYLVLSGLDLSPDEAYYWNWSRHLDVGYFSKPPLIAWINAASTGLFGAHTWAVRFPAVLLGTGTLALLFFAARDLYGRRAAWITLLLILATPANVAMNFVMTIDSPLAFGWALAFWAMTRAFFLSRSRVDKTENGSDAEGSESLLSCCAGPAFWWSLAGVGTVIATLSKQMGVFLAVLPILSLLALRKQPEGFWRRWPVLLTAVLVAAVPVVAWNVANSFVTFTHTGEHFDAKPWTPAEVLNTLPEFLASQWGLLNPVTATVLAAVIAGGLRRFRHLGDRERFLFVWGPMPLLIFVLLALRQRVHPNWPLVFYLPCFVLLGGCFAGEITRWSQSHLRRWLKPALVTGFAMVALMMALPPVLPALGLAGGRFDAYHRMRGWHELANETFPYLTAEVHGADQAGMSGLAMMSGKRPILAYTSRHPVDALTFYLPGHPRVYRWSDQGIHTQHELWPGPKIHFGKDALVFSDTKFEDSPQATEGFRANFDVLKPLGEIEIVIGPSRVRRYWLYQGENLQGWQTF